MYTPVVLIVDDDEDVCTVVREELETEGYTVEVAANGRDALRRLQTAPRPALILLDLGMPVLDGFSLLRELEADAELASIHVIVVTAALETAETAGLRYPLLRKPFSPQALLEAVTMECPRLWDADEPPTSEDHAAISEDTSGEWKRAVAWKLPADWAETRRQICSVCRARASARCVGCGEAFCRTCLDAGPDGQCARCWRAKCGLG